MTTVNIKQEDVTYVMDEDGLFRCTHENVEVEYDRGGDGITEPGPSWSVYCSDCHNEDMTDSEVEAYIDAANEPPDYEYEGDEY